MKDKNVQNQEFPSSMIIYTCFDIVSEISVHQLYKDKVKGIKKRHKLTKKELTGL